MYDKIYKKKKNGAIPFLQEAKRQCVTILLNLTSELIYDSYDKLWLFIYRIYVSLWKVNKMKYMS